MKTFAWLFLALVVGLGGWILGSVYPAPSSVIAQISPQTLVAHARSDLAGIQVIQGVQGMTWKSLQSLLGEVEVKRLTGEAINLAQKAGTVIKVEHVVDQATKDAEMLTPSPEAPAAVLPAVAPSAPAVPSTVPGPTPALAPQAAAAKASAPPPHVATATAPVVKVPPPAATALASTRSTVSAAVAPLAHGAFEALMSLCPVMQITDAPAADSERHILNFSSLVSVQGAVIAVDPIRDACLSSGYGDRHGKLHKGIDFYNASGGPILAAGDGTILEMKYRDDYGNMVLIDHGRGVYTRYAHLSSFHSGLAVGAHVHAGDEIGLMGNTAAYPVPLHLHYELLLGNYGNPKGSFGLTPHSPFEYRPPA